MPKLRPVKEQPPKASLLFEQAEPGKEPETEKPFEEEEPEVKVEVKPAKTEDAAADELKKQIQALKRAEQEQRDRADKAEREREDARKEARERGTEAEQVRTEAVQSKAEFIKASIEKETEAAESAERALQAAMSEGDAMAAAKAQRRLAQAEAKLESLRNGKDAIEAEINEAKNAPKKEEPRQVQQPTVDQVIDSWNVPATAKHWLKTHQDYVTDPRKNAKIQALHWDILDEGHPQYSDAYFESLETHLGMRKAPEDEEAGEERNSIVSAPVSREVPANNGQRQTGTITLTPAQREAAKASGVTEAEYAKQLIKFKKAKEDGEYGERR